MIVTEYILESPFGAVTVIDTGVGTSGTSGKVASPVGTPIPAVTSPDSAAFRSDFVAETVTLSTLNGTSTVYAVVPGVKSGIKGPPVTVKADRLLSLEGAARFTVTV